MKSTVFLPGGFFVWLSLAHPLFGQGSTLLVTNLEDGGSGSLRMAIALAQSWDKISFAVSGRIVLTNGELLISKSLSILGPGATNLAICGDGQNRVLKILPSVRLLVSGVTICDGHAADGTTGTSNSPSGGDGFAGGGIYNSGFLAITGCVLSNCAAGNGGRGYFTENVTTPVATNWMGGAGGQGGAIYNAGDLALASSLLISNASGAGGYAGGTRDYGAPGARGGGGGAVYSEGGITLTDCVFYGNKTGDGGSGYQGYYNGFGNLPFDAGHQGGPGGGGGAVCDVGESGTSMVRCQFRFNASGAGGTGSGYQFMALVAHAGAGGPGGGGGAVWSQNSVWMNGCTFLANHTGPGGAGGIATASGMGGEGGIGGPGGAIFAKGELSMNDCNCSSNYSGIGGAGGRCVPGSGGSGASGGSGGAIHAANVLRLDRCAFSYNLAGSGGQGASAAGSSSFSYSAAGEGGTGGSGGAVYCEADLEANQCSVNGNESGNAGSPGVPGFDLDLNGQNTTSGSDGGQGGGVYGEGPIVLTACTLSGNRGGNGGSAGPRSAALIAATAGSEGPVQTNRPGTSPRPKLIIYTWRGQPGGAGGCGGLFSASRLRMVLCTVSANVGGAGGFGGDSGGGYWEYLPGGGGGSGGSGGICCVASNRLELVACTISGNFGGSGGTGGLGVTVPDTTGRTGQGIGGTGGTGGVCRTNSTGAPASLINNLVAANVGGSGGPGGPYPGSKGNPGGPDLQGAFTSLGHNLIGRPEGSSGLSNGVSGDLVGSTNAPLDPILGSLEDNGGPTLTMALLHGSPALDAGDDAVLQSPYLLNTDQRGFPRKSGSHVDIGAFEFQFRDPAVHPLATAPLLSGALSLNESGTASNGSESNAPPAGLSFRLWFTEDSPGATFSVLATTNLFDSPQSWRVLGQPHQTAPGIFTFIDVDATNNPVRFYRVSSP